MSESHFPNMSRRGFTLSTLAIASLSLGNAACAQSDEYTEGQHYHLLKDPVPTEGEGVEVRELFWYGCPHCYELEPYVVNWLENKPEAANYIRDPALFNPNWVFDAKAFFAFEELGILDEVHGPYFEYLHKDKVRVGDADGLVKFLAKFDVEDKKVRDALSSFSVDSQIRKHMLSQPKYMVMGVPAFIVNGKYRTSLNDAGSQDRLFSLINYLVEKEQK